jgi:hypothetical protein
LSAMNTIPFLDNSFGEGLQEGSFAILLWNSTPNKQV